MISGHKIRKALAWAIVCAVIPLLTDAAADPYSDRSIARGWVHGAAIMAAAGTIAWAVAEIDPQKGEAAQ